MSTQPIPASNFSSSQGLADLRCLFDHKRVTEQELDFNKDDQMVLLNNDNKDWWFVRNRETGETGYVPATFVKILHDHEGDIGEESEPLDAEIDHNDEMNQSSDSDEGDNSDGKFDSEEEGEGCSSDDDSTDHSDNESLKNDQMKELLQELQKRKSRSHRKHLPPPLPLFDSTLPQGFRHSTLYETIKAGSGSYQEYLTPELASNGVSFKDVNYDSKNMIRKRDVKCSIAFTIQLGKNIPYFGDLDVVGRHVRMSLFDKSHILSNIHSVPATVVDDDGTWSFKTQKVIQIYIERVVERRRRMLCQIG
jgi:hypothetical protein